MAVYPANKAAVVAKTCRDTVQMIPNISLCDVFFFFSRAVSIEKNISLKVLQDCWELQRIGPQDEIVRES